MDEFHDAESQEDYEYVMPLSGTSPDKVSFSDDTKPFRGNRRGSNMTDATDKRHNLKGNEPDDFPLASPPASPRRVSHGIPTLPPLFSVDDENTQDEAAGGESINSASSPTSASVSTSSLSAKTKYHTKKRDSHAMQITMAGDIQEVPIKSSGTTLDTFISDSTGPRGAARPRASTASSMGGSIHSFTGTHDGDDDLDAVSSNYSDTVEPIIFCGITMPMWLSTLIKKPPKMSQISIFLVTVAPCFWCSSKNIQGGSTGTNRAVLTRLNILTICITFIQLFAACWLFTLLLIVDDSPGILKGFAPHFWNLNGASFAVGILAFILIFTCFVTIRVIKEVDLVGAIRYLWLMLWLIPFEIFFTVSLFDRHLVTNVWVRHWWSEPQFSYFRYFFCLEDTDDNLCMVPIDGGEDYETEEDWCQDKYNASSCTYIRDEAQADAGFALLAFYTGLAASGCVLLLLMFLMINLLETIISRPIVQKSRETNVPAWLLLPTVGTGLVGAVFVFSPSSLLSSISGTEGAWIGIVYLVSAALFLVALLLGWFLSAFTIRNNIDKNNKNVAVLIVIGVMAANTVMLAAIFVASIMFSGNLLITPIDQSARGQVACFVDRGVSCTCCDCEITEDVCPEWTLEEVTKILQSQLKQSGTLAAIFILYSISVLRFSFVLRKHLTLYQIDYV